MVKGGTPQRGARPGRDPGPSILYKDHLQLSGFHQPKSDFRIGPYDLAEILHVLFFRNSKNFFLLTFFRQISSSCFFGTFLCFASHDIMSKNESCQKLFMLHVNDHVARANLLTCRAVSLCLMTRSYDMIKTHQKVPKNHRDEF